jgi:hypothetical protein
MEDIPSKQVLPTPEAKQFNSGYENCFYEPFANFDSGGINYDNEW